MTSASDAPRAVPRYRDRLNRSCVSRSRRHAAIIGATEGTGEQVDGAVELAHDEAEG
jgi:hypothetical protein